MIRFRGKVSFVTKKDGAVHARGIYKDAQGNKKQVWRKVTGKKSDAKESVVAEIEKILNLAEEKEKEKTFADLADYYKTKHAVPAVFVEDVKVSGKKGWRVMHHDIDQMKAYFKDLPLKDLTRDRIQEYRLFRLNQPVRKVNRETEESYSAQRSLSGVNHELRTLRAALNVAAANEWIKKVPSFKDLISSASENTRDVIPTENEFARILAACSGRREHIKPIVIMIADIGARPVELWNLTWADVDFERETVVLTSDKGKKRLRRTLGMTERLKEILENMDRINEYVFGGIRSIKTAWAKIQKEAKVYHLTPYHLRHLFATRIDAMPISQNAKQKLMGHTDGAMFGRYAKLTDEVMISVADELSKNPYLPIQEADSIN